MFANISLNNPGLTIAPCRHGTFAFQSNDMIGRLLLGYGEWAEQEISFLTSFLRPGDTVLDIGGHIGTITVPLARAVGPQGRVLSFEAQRLIYLNHCTNVHLNGLLNVHPTHAVVAEAEGFVNLAEYEPAKISNSGGFTIPVGATGTQRYTSVRKIVLDKFLVDLDQCRLIKMDIEGHEPAALAGMLQLIKRLKHIIYVEANTKQRFEAIRSQMSALDYDCYWHCEAHWNPNNYRRNPNNVFGDKTDLNVLALPRGWSERRIGLKSADNFSDVAHFAAG